MPQLRGNEPILGLNTIGHLVNPPIFKVDKSHSVFEQLIA
jgi:hypothetical protein